jgi:hypothetical protein
MQYSLSHRANVVTQLNTDIGINAVIKVFGVSAMPVNCGTADAGTVLVTFAGNATAFGTVAGQTLTASAVANAVGAAGAGAGTTALYYRIYPAAATTTNAVVQGTCFGTSTIVTSALTAANGNVLTFAAVSGIAVGQTISGTGVPAGATVIATTGTTVTMSLASTAGVANTTTITFSGEMALTNTSIASGQTVGFSSLTNTAFGV